MKLRYIVSLFLLTLSFAGLQARRKRCCDPNRCENRGSGKGPSRGWGRGYGDQGHGGSYTWAGWIPAKRVDAPCSEYNYGPWFDWGYNPYFWWY